MQILILLITTLFYSAQQGRAWETDDFNLPATELADLAPVLEDYIDLQLTKAIEHTNDKISFHESCIKTPYKKWKRACYIDRTSLVPRIDQKKSIKRHEELRVFFTEPQGIADILYSQIGVGFPTSQVEKFLNKTQFKEFDKPTRFLPEFRKSIFADRHAVFLTSAYTINLYQIYLGTDKVGHLFQQGYSYYRIYKESLKRKETEALALYKAIQWGQEMEEGFYGLPMSGVFSNADLAANLLGLKWYVNLTEAISITLAERKANQKRPPVLRLNAQSRWEKNPGRELKKGWLKDFFTPHLNEALNPSLYTLKLVGELRKVVQDKLCPTWKAQSSPRQTLTTNLRTLYGEDYGFREEPGRMAGVEEICL